MNGMVSALTRFGVVFDSDDFGAAKQAFEREVTCGYSLLDVVDEAEAT